MSQVSGIDYEEKAADYAVHRRVHGGVYQELVERFRPVPDAAVLEVGCGTGNYVRSLSKHTGCIACGLDPSAAMLAHARSQNKAVAWVLGRAEQLGFASGTFDLVFSVDVIHHVAEKAAFYAEAARVLRCGGRLLTVTDSAGIIRRREVLAGYFPETIEPELARYPRIARLKAWMRAVGLREIEELVVEEPYTITSAQPFRDRVYSSLHLISETAWRAGLQRLERDLRYGSVQGKSRYTCLWGRKPEA